MLPPRAMARANIAIHFGGLRYFYAQKKCPIRLSLPYGRRIFIVCGVFFIKDAAALLPKKIPDMPTGKIFVCAIGGPWPFDFFHFLRGRACCTGVGELFPGGCGQFCRQFLLRYNRDKEDLSCCQGFCSARGMPSGRPGGLIFQGGTLAYLGYPGFPIP